MEMLHAMRDAVLEHKADVGLALTATATAAAWSTTPARNLRRQGRGDAGARLVGDYHECQFVVDVKSTGLFSPIRCCKARRQNDLLEDRPLLYQAPHPRTERTGGL